MKFPIELGPTSDSLTKQLKGMVPLERARTLEEIKKAMGTMYIFGLLTDSDLKKAAKRLTKLIQIEIDKYQRTARNIANAKKEAEN